MPSFGSPSGLTDSDPIEVDSPPTPKPKARIIVLDSSPLAPSTHQRQQGTTMSGAGSRFQQAMNGKGKGSLAPTGYRSSTPNSNGASMADLVNARSAGLMRGQTSAASSSAGSSSKHARTSPTLSDDDVRLLDQPRKKVKSDASREGSSRLSSIDLERFRFSDKSAQGQSSGRPSSDSDLSDEDAPGSDADVQLMEVEEERPKKRRLVRGGQPAPESPQKPISAAPKVESPKGKERAVTGNSLDAQESKADRILLIHPEWPRKEILAALQAHNWDSRAAIDALEKEKRERAQQRGAATVARLANGHGGCPSSARPQSANPSSVRPVAGSSAQAKARANAPTRKPARDVPSEDEGGGYSSSENENGYGQKEHKDEEAALKWFNTCDENAMMDTTNCNPTQAQTMMSMRPFKSVQDVQNRLGDKNAKGVTPRLFNQCVELMAGYFEVDSVLARCEKVGRELNRAMAAWNVESRPSSRLGSPAASADDEDDGALTLSSVVRGGAAKTGDYLEQQPSNLAKGIQLKDYQLVGVNWLNLLYNKKTSCILADEMGLGKTAQVISFMAHLQQRGISGPHLVVVPSSVLENWSREFKAFAPGIRVETYYGNQREREQLRAEFREDDGIEVMITTYDMAAGGPLDHNFLRKRGFDVCVFDEGHMLKNRKSQKYEKLLRIKAKWRLLLTGTPLQNNLQELVSLLNFIMPDYFTEAEDALAAIFKVKPGAHKNQLSQQRVDRAKRMMQPFVLRRKKDKVLRDLTTKTEVLEYCEMTRAQRKLYQDALARTRSAAQQEGSAVGMGSRVGSRTKGGRRNDSQSSNVLMELRKAANHPLLFRTIFNEKKIAALAKDYVKEPEHADENLEHLKEDFAINSDAELSFLAHAWPATRKHKLAPQDWMNAGKVKALERLIPEIKARGDRILIFSQFTTVLDILCVCLENMGIKYVGFTGATNVGDRQVLVDQFTQDEEITVFLLSTKAGGLGINLVAANVVIMYDQDFNPQNDKQAADRCYRMGQKKDVTVIKLICKDTIDEDILSLGTRKLELADRVSGEGAEADDGELEKQAEKSLMARLAARFVADGQGAGGVGVEEGEGKEG